MWLSLWTHTSCFTHLVHLSLGVTLSLWKNYSPVQVHPLWALGSRRSWGQGRSVESVCSKSCSPFPKWPSSAEKWYFKENRSICHLWLILTNRMSAGKQSDKHAVASDFCCLSVAFRFSACVCTYFFTASFPDLKGHCMKFSLPASCALVLAESRKKTLMMSLQTKSFRVMCLDACENPQILLLWCKYFIWRCQKDELIESRNPDFSCVHCLFNKVTLHFLPSTVSSSNSSPMRKSISVVRTVVEVLM